jgi:hypothetical protein
VSDPEPRALDPAIVFAALARHGVEFVLVGGLASQAHGATRLTEDLDLCPAWTSENLERVAGALKDLGARLRIGWRWLSSGNSSNASTSSDLGVNMIRPTASGGRKPCPELRISEANSGHLRPSQSPVATPKALHLAIF